MKDRPEKEPGCWYAERAEEEGKELELGRAPEIKSSAGAGVCIATRHKVMSTVLGQCKSLFKLDQTANFELGTGKLFCKSDYFIGIIVIQLLKVQTQV